MRNNRDGYLTGGMHMNQYQDDDWQQEEQRRREAYYRMNSQNSNTPDALEQIFRGPLNWMNLLMIGINIVVFVIMEILGSTEDTGFMLQWGAACRPLILDGEWYRLFTSMFLHFGIYHLVNNMAVLLFMGDMVEKAVGHWKYLMIYLGSGMDIQSQSNIVSVGASGAIYGIIGGVFVLMIKNKKQVREIVIRRLVFVIAVTIYYGSQAAQIDNAAHVGGLIGGIVLTVLFTLHWNHSRKGYVAE